MHSVAVHKEKAHKKLL